jgi:hypothetical protein
MGREVDGAVEFCAFELKRLKKRKGHKATKPEATPTTGKIPSSTRCWKERSLVGYMPRTTWFSLIISSFPSLQTYAFRRG